VVFLGSDSYRIQFKNKINDLTNYCKNAQDPELRLYELNRLLIETIRCENRLFLDRIRVKHGVSDIEYGGLEEYVNENGIGAVLVATVKCLYRVRTKKAIRREHRPSVYY